MTRYNDSINELVEALKVEIGLLETAPTEWARNYEHKKCKLLQERLNKELAEYIDFLKDCQ
ncbi:MAG: hypothetical protein DBY32_04630 [Phascolarctobacterium sp.]|nr:MAG: hypothetical protein DBY32_04630 [Phascolarctobacterium sp.]